jgi:hypothetical protein
MYVMTDKAPGFPLTHIFYTTHVRTMTYDELSANYSSLLTDYETLFGSYDALSTQYGGLDSTYSSLQTTFESLNSSYFTQKARNQINNDSRRKHGITKIDQARLEYQATYGEKGRDRLRDLKKVKS